MDDFTLNRLTRLIAQHRDKFGRDISEAEIKQAGFSASDIDYLVRRKLVDKHQVTVGSGATENRFKLHKDWRTLNKN